MDYIENQYYIRVLEYVLLCLHYIVLTVSYTVKNIYVNHII